GAGERRVLGNPCLRSRDLVSLSPCTVSPVSQGRRKTQRRKDNKRSAVEQGARGLTKHSGRTAGRYVNQGSNRSN
ncbi:hypothetical protein BaRGS_00029545, partial [Batillaria attramentaria]